MSRPRVKETDSGIQGEITVAIYDEMQKRFRDKGWIKTKAIIKSGITDGLALEVGPGPGYLGLEWLKSTQGTTLKGVEISKDMISLAERNAEEYGLSDRVEYFHSSGEELPFDDESFDAVFTAGSLHEWSNPRGTFNEIWRVLKSGGRIFISDLRRDSCFLLRWFLWITVRPKEIRPGLKTSLDAAYTRDELRELVKVSDLTNCEVTKGQIELKLTGRK
jgi:ubiquinone/menaquinone biosynthesis C-methylase UbiE